MSENVVFVDWLAFTWQAADMKENFKRVETGTYPTYLEAFLLAFPEFDGLDVINVQHRCNYQYSLALSDSMCINYDADWPSAGDFDHGINVQISGSGIDDFRKIIGYDDIRDIFRELKRRGCSISRLDLTYDDFSKTYKPLDLFHFWKDGLMISDMRSGSYHWSARADGQTFYLGKRGSGKYMRVYDKEYQSDGQIKSVRYEFEFHREKAETILNAICDYGELSFADLISQFCRVVTEDSKNKRKSDRPVAEHWLEFLRNTSLTHKVKVKLSPEKVSSDVESFLRWVRHVRGALNKLYQYVGQEEFVRYVSSFKQSDYVQRYIIDELKNKAFIKCMLRETAVYD